MGEESRAGLLRGCVVVIPALDPEEMLRDYAAALLEQGAEQVVAVDDGSGPASRPIFEALEAMEGCTVLRHERNRGKGRALKDAFAFIAGQSRWEGCTVVTADADGQHRVEDVCTVGRAAAEETDRLVLGVRDLTGPQVPARSKLGNRAAMVAVGDAGVVLRRPGRAVRVRDERADPFGAGAQAAAAGAHPGPVF